MTDGWPRTRGDQEEGGGLPNIRRGVGGLRMTGLARRQPVSVGSVLPQLRVRDLSHPATAARSGAHREQAEELPRADRGVNETRISRPAEPAKQLTIYSPWLQPLMRTFNGEAEDASRSDPSSVSRGRC